MISKKYLIIGIIILVILIIGVLVFYFFSNQDLCTKISDKTLKQKCLVCETAENSVDCKDSVYTEFVFLKKDKDLCNNLVQQHRKNECNDNLEKSILRAGSAPRVETTESGEVRVVD
jgi:hypothetical protein